MVVVVVGDPPAEAMEHVRADGGSGGVRVWESRRSEREMSQGSDACPEDE